MKLAATAALLLLMSYLSWQVFPGHTWLQQDSQIYTPILENLRDPAVLRKDMVVERPHVAFTIYDEVTLGLQRITGLDLYQVLMAGQILFRAVALWGVYLIATSLGLAMTPAFAVTLLWSLGASVNGPAVLTVEYEAVPRAFAAPLLMLAIGFGAQGLWFWSGVASAIAVLFHPPAAWPLLLVYPWRKASRIALVPVLAGAALLAIIAYAQIGVTEPQRFFTLLDPQLEMLQRMRAPYNWLDLWWRSYLPEYIVLAAIYSLACWKLWSRLTPGLRIFACILLPVAILTMPVSFLLLNAWKWSLLPQLQPMRALLFVVALASILSAAAGCVAARSGRHAESFAWFLLPCFLPLQTAIFTPHTLPQVAVWLGCTAACVAVCADKGRMWVLAGAYWAFAAVVTLYPRLHTPELAALSSWARAGTPQDSVFFFADNGKANYPGVFRSEARRAVYVDWKAGGQVNYLPAFANEWWRRWNAVQRAYSTDTESHRFELLDIDYLVVNAGHELKGKPDVFHNANYRVYRLR